jgi:hypothetical protein
MNSVKSFGILIEGIPGVGRVIAIIARERNVKIGIPLGWGELSALES